jgi:hypothetical protein
MRKKPAEPLLKEKVHHPIKLSLNLASNKKEKRSPRILLLYRKLTNLDAMERSEAAGTRVYLL